MNCVQLEILPLESEIDQLKKDLFQARYEASYYKNLHQRNVAARERIQFEYETEILRLKQKYKEKEEAYLHEIQELKAKVKLRERQLFGKKSEKKSKNKSQDKSPSKRKRGQQAGKKSPRKKDYSHLPVVIEAQEIAENKRTCPCCNTIYADMGTSEDSDIIEVLVKAHVRRVRRKKYKRTCNCQSQPVILTAPQAPKVLSKSHLGNSVWVHFLLQKYWHGLPLHRIIRGLASHDLAISAGTVIWGFMRLLILFRLVYQKIVEKSLQDKHWHADETGWKVFEALEGKINNRWFLWVFRSTSAAVFILDPSRSARVVEEFFGDDSKGIISCDRYRAYFCFVSKSNEPFLIAYCWVHVRRDFLALAKDWPIHESWGMDWGEEIRHLYHLNDLRIAQQNEQQFLECKKKLEEGISSFKDKADKQLEDNRLSDPCRKVLESLNRHWNGLTTFLKHAEIPMDNNKAERELRGGAVGRKNYYGSGSVESAEFTAIMFTIIQTLLIWGINPQTWFNGFFDFMGSNWDQKFDKWLPWSMSPEEIESFSLKRGYDPPN